MLSWGIPKLSNIFSWKFPFHMIFIPEFPEFSVERFAFRKFKNFGIFWNFLISLKISVPFVSISKISEIWVEWKVPRDNLVRCIQIFGNILPGIIILIWISSLNFGLNGSLCGFRIFPDFLENVHRKFPYHLSPFLNFRNLRLDGKLSWYLKFLITHEARQV